MKSPEKTNHSAQDVPAHFMHVADSHLSAQPHKRNILSETAHLVEEPDGKVDAELAIKISQKLTSPR